MRSTCSSRKDILCRVEIRRKCCFFTFFQILEAAGKDVCLHAHAHTHTHTHIRTGGVSTLSSKPEILHLNSEREVWKWNTPGYIKTLPRIWTQVLSIWHGAVHVSRGMHTAISNVACVYILLHADSLSLLCVEMGLSLTCTCESESSSTHS